MFVIGLSRTGTTSVHRALQLLGFKSAHWTVPGGRLFQLQDALSFDAAGDIGVSYAFEALAEAFPAARFIYTTRPVELWAASVIRHYGAETPAKLRALAEGVVTEDRALPETVFAGDPLWRLIHYSLYLNHTTWEAAYIAYDERVRRFFSRLPDAPARLLRMDISAERDHWEALCTFLGVARPSTPFPHISWRIEAASQFPARTRPVFDANSSQSPMSSPSDSSLEPLPPAHTASARVLRAVGLHIGRTAGTSFYNFVEGKMGREHCLPLSAFGWGIQQGRVTPSEFIAALPIPQFTYGHYVHESWMHYLSRFGSVRTFSMYRNPSDRRRSLAKHFTKIDGQNRESNLLKNLHRSDIWCQEVLRCFPSVGAVHGDKPIWWQALVALSLIDDLVSYDESDKYAENLVRMLGRTTGSSELPRINASPVDQSGSPTEFSIIDGQDDLLYDAICRGERAPDAAVSMVREEQQSRYSDPGRALACFQNHLLVYMRAELRSMATLEVNLEILKAQRRSLDQIIQFLAE